VRQIEPEPNSAETNDLLGISALPESDLERSFALEINILLAFQNMRLFLIAKFVVGREKPFVIGFIIFRAAGKILAARVFLPKILNFALVHLILI
jgi:hypothetical protein